MSLELSYYNLAASICSKIYDEIKGKILIEFNENNVKSMDINPLLEYGNRRILEETSVVFKKSKKTKGIACPVSITTNNTVLYYTYDNNDKENILNYIKETDVVKINLGVTINDCVANLCETFTIIENKKINKIIKCLNKIVDSIEDMIEPGEINDEIRILIESKCTEKEIFPIENCISFQHRCNFDEPKYLILNYKKRYDFNDYLIGLQNLCFEYEQDEVYTIQISVVPVDDSDDRVVYKNLDKSHLYRFNENHYSLKLKSSREFFNECKSKHKNYVFDIQEYSKIIKNKFGINECIKNGILEEYPITVVTQNGVPLPVITKIFTLLVTEEGCKILKYN